MSSRRLSDSVAKLKRADHHCDLLNKEVVAFYEEHPYEIVRKSDPDNTCHTFKVCGLRPLPEHWPLMLGELIYNYRSSLDHLIYELGIKNAGHAMSPADERACMFPLYEDPAKFRDNGRRRIAMLGGPEQTLVEWFQPYNRQHFSRETFTLGYLEHLGVVDKHRRLNVLQQVMHGRTHVVYPHIRWDYPPASDTPLGDGGDIAIAWCSAPDPDVYMHPDNAIDVTIGEGRITATLRLQLEAVTTAVHKVFYEFRDFRN